MDRELLQKMFCNKINTEIEIFKHRMKRKTPEQIIGRSYKITCMLNIYEDMVAMSLELDEKALSRLLAIPDLLAFLFRKWLQVEDSFLKEIHECNKEYLKAIGVITTEEGEEKECED